MSSYPVNFNEVNSSSLSTGKETNSSCNLSANLSQMSPARGRGLSSAPLKTAAAGCILVVVQQAAWWWCSRAHGGAARWRSSWHCCFTKVLGLTPPVLFLCGVSMLGFPLDYFQCSEVRLKPPVMFLWKQKPGWMGI